MPASRLLVRAAPFALFATLTVATTYGPAATAPTPAQPGSAAAPPAPEVEIRYTDDSVMKLKLLDERIELHTKYGTLAIPASEVRRIEFAARVTPDVAQKITSAVDRLGHPDFQTREKASSELKGYRERAYPTLLKAVKHTDPEVSRRAEEAVRYLQVKVPAGNLEPRENDVV